MSVPDIIIEMKNFTALRELVVHIPFTPEYLSAIDQMNEYFKDFPNYILTKPEIVDPGLVHVITAHVEGRCRLQDRAHSLEECSVAQIKHWHARMYQIAERENPALVKGPPLDSGPMEKACIERINLLYEFFIRQPVLENTAGPSDGAS